MCEFTMIYFLFLALLPVWFPSVCLARPSMLLPSLSRYEGFLRSFFAVAASLNPSWVYLYCCQHLVTTISDFLWLLRVFWDSSIRQLIIHLHRLSALIISQHRQAPAVYVRQSHAPLLTLFLWVRWTLTYLLTLSWSTCLMFSRRPWWEANDW